MSKGRWKFIAGCRPHTVTVYGRSAGGVLYARCRDPGTRSGKRRAKLSRIVALYLRHRTPRKSFVTNNAAETL